MNANVPPPLELLQLQAWVAQAIQRSPQEPLTLSSAYEAAQYIKPFKNLSPNERIQIYHSTYWSNQIRFLIGHLRLLVRFLGYEKFQHRIAIPYLKKYPPPHWAMVTGLLHLPHWVKEDYQEEDQATIQLFLQIDMAYKDCSLETALQPFNPSIYEDPFSVPVFLQPHVHIASADYNVFQLRETALKHTVEYWENHPFPILSQGPNYYIVFRNHLNKVVSEEINEKQYFLLNCIQKGCSLNQAKAQLEKTQSIENFMELYTWFYLWIQRHLFTEYPPDT
ncbi:MAG: putative DNA-binding domain-containing protein [Simkania sp.]|nr:putative DNA-binding domain-containing protein [Simkania sp.]